METADEGETALLKTGIICIASSCSGTINIGLHIENGRLRRVLLPAWDGEPWPHGCSVDCEVPETTDVSALDSHVADQTAAYLSAYFSGRKTAPLPALKLDDIGQFAHNVYKEVSIIMPGFTDSYKNLARRVGGPGYARAVGGALSRNPWPILVPCHRVIASNGSLGGFGCGSEWKRWLIEHELIAFRE